MIVNESERRAFMSKNTNNEKLLVSNIFFFGAFVLSSPVLSSTLDSIFVAITI